MEQDQLVTRLSEILQKVRSDQEQTEAEFEKLQVALTGVLRLLACEEGSPLTRMQGSPQDLKGYIIRLVSELHSSVKNRGETLSSKLELVLYAVRNP